MKLKFKKQKNQKLYKNKKNILIKKLNQLKDRQKRLMLNLKNRNRFKKGRIIN
jgi:hypothetical protein